MQMEAEDLYISSYSKAIRIMICIVYYTHVWIYVYIPYNENYMHSYVCVKNARLRVLTIYMCKLLTPQ